MYLSIKLNVDLQKSVFECMPCAKDKYDDQTITSKCYIYVYIHNLSSFNARVREMNELSRSKPTKQTKTVNIYPFKKKTTRSNI